jgi:hypothetical protein
MAASAELRGPKTVGSPWPLAIASTSPVDFPPQLAQPLLCPGALASALRGQALAFGLVLADESLDHVRMP